MIVRSVTISRHVCLLLFYDVSRRHNTLKIYQRSRNTEGYIGGMTSVSPVTGLISLHHPMGSGRSLYL